MRRVYLNIAAFVVLSTALIAWSIATLFPIAAFEDHDVVSARFAEAPGLRAGYEVTYLGHAVGRVAGVELVPGASEVRFELDAGHELPAAVDAAVRRRSAIGEPYVDLSPTSGTSPTEGPRLADGDHIPEARTSSPIEYSDLFRSLDRLVSALDPEALQTVIREAAHAVDGRGDDFRRLVTSTHDLVTTASENGDEIAAFVDDLGRVASVAATHRDALGSSIDDLSALTQTLRAATPQAETVLDRAPATIELINGLVAETDASLVCVADGFAVLDLAFDEQAAAALGTVLQRSADISHIIDGALDPRDGYVRLKMLMSVGEPVPIYAEPVATPPAPSVADCPDRALDDPPLAGGADEAGKGPGGRAPGPDGNGEVPDRRPPAPEELASGTSDQQPERPFLARVLDAALPAALAAAGLAALAYLVHRRRGAAASAVSAREVPTLPEGAGEDRSDT